MAQLMDWRVYADATCAGLSALLPIPGLDLIFELGFRRRMPGTIARARGATLAPGAAAELSRGDWDWLSARGCLVVPVFVFRAVIKRIWRKIVYILAMADAAEQLSEYWHRAFLLDHIIRAGHAAPGVDVERSAKVLRRVLDEADTSALKGIGRQVVAGASHVPRLLRRAKRGSAAQETGDQAQVLRAHWDLVYASLVEVALRYNELYAERLGVSEKTAENTGRALDAEPRLQ